MLLSVCGTAVATEAGQTQNHWAYDVIRQWTDEGWIEGFQDENFEPDRPITRVEFFALVNTCFGFYDEQSVNFTDIAQTDPNYATVAAAVCAGYVKGYPDGSMKPNQLLSRQEAAMIISTLKQLDDNPEAVSRFIDEKTIPKWSRGAVGSVTGNGYGYCELPKNNNFFGNILTDVYI